jgi:hypothetical protein
MKTYSRIGGLTAAARRDNDRHAAFMRRAFRESFRTGHRCRLCPEIEIPADVSPHDREQRAAALWQLHWERMRARRARGRTRRRMRTKDAIPTRDRN